jgi:hypothetical protein
MSPQANKAFTAFKEWYTSQPKIKPLSVEQICYSKHFDFAGTWDGMFEIDGKVILYDLKTTNASRTAPLGIYPEMFLQLGGYSFAHREEFPLENIDDLMIVRIGKDGILNTLKASEIGLSVEDCENRFIDLLKIYKFMTPLAKQLTALKETK